MTPTSFQTTAVGRIAIAIGAVTITGIVFLALFFTLKIRFFGSLNDACIALAAILGAGLAWLVHPFYRAQLPRWSRLALAAAVLGALIVTLGAWLVISATTGYFLAALYMTFGNAFLGLWVLGFNRAAAQTGHWPRRLTQFGQMTGIVMVFGLVTIFGILGGVDSDVNPPWHVNLGNVGGLGWYLLFPIWSVWLGRVLHSASATVSP
ncbi:MAG: hypothetical protein HUU38_07015 [Anaerolineales bacterium]|nr:hypothetical protein [Anaerolineales bacterium]